MDQEEAGHKIAELRAEITKHNELYYQSDAPIISISSTYLREALAQGDLARYLLPDAAAEVIREKGLYAFKEG